MEIADLNDLLAKAHLPETTVRINLRGDLQAEWERKERELAEETATQTLAPPAHVQELAREVRALEEEIAKSTVTFTLRALPRRPWMELLKAHPPREGHEEDKAFGVNNETFFDALVTACLVDPELTAEQVTNLLDSVTSAQFDQLVEAAWSVNRRESRVPFSETASVVTLSSEATQRQQSGSGSARRGSRAKSPRR